MAVCASHFSERLTEVLDCCTCSWSSSDHTLLPSGRTIDFGPQRKLCPKPFAEGLLMDNSIPSGETSRVLTEEVMFTLTSCSALSSSALRASVSSSAWLPGLLIDIRTFRVINEVVTRGTTWHARPSSLAPDIGRRFAEEQEHETPPLDPMTQVALGSQMGAPATRNPQLGGLIMYSPTSKGGWNIESTIPTTLGNADSIIRFVTWQLRIIVWLLFDTVINRCPRTTL
jgi:hypothetical protein